MIELTETIGVDPKIIVTGKKHMPDKNFTFDHNKTCIENYAKLEPNNCSNAEKKK